MDRAKVMPMLKGVLVLAVIALCSGLLLGAFNMLTYVDPLQSTLDGFREDSGAKGEFTMLVEEDTAVDGSAGKIKYYAVSTDGYHAFLTSGKSSYGEVQLYIYIKDAQIFKIVLGDFNDDFAPNLKNGTFFSQFYGIDLSGLDVSGVDTVANATNSSNAAKDAVDAAVQYYNENVAGGENNG